MESSVLIKGLPYCNDESGFGLYYNKYKYRLIAEFRGISWIRYISNVEKFEKYLEFSPYNYPYDPNHSSMTYRKRIINAGGSIDELRKFVEWRPKILAHDTKVVISGHRLTFYYNNDGLIKDFLNTFQNISRLEASEKVLKKAYERGVIYHKNPKHLFRVYLKHCRLEPEETLNFWDTIHAYAIQPCPSLVKRQTLVGRKNLWVGKVYDFYISLGNFVDIGSEDIVTVLALKWPNLISKVCSIQQR